MILYQCNICDEPINIGTDEFWLIKAGNIRHKRQQGNASQKNKNDIHICARHTPNNCEAQVLAPMLISWVASSSN